MIPANFVNFPDLFFVSQNDCRDKRFPYPISTLVSFCPDILEPCCTHRVPLWYPFSFVWEQVLCLLRSRHHRFISHVITSPVFFTSLYRDYLFKQAMQDQDSNHPPLLYLSLPLGIPLLLLGSTLVLSSMYKLGVANTYLGDYFGIFMNERVETFPFSFTTNPMYTGSTMVFLSGAVFQGSFAGLVMTIWVFGCYQVALLFEGYLSVRVNDGRPFTTRIYKEKMEREEKEE
jgi:hypothetical protein